MKIRTLAVTLALTLIPATACWPTGGERVLEIRVLSNRADLLSGGDALVEILLSEGADASGLQVSLDGEDVSSMFALRPNGRVQGLVTGLPVGEGMLTATLGGSESVRISLTNHPIGGPIFAGPQVQPWLCRTEELGFGPALDAQCNAPAKIEFLYRSTESDAFQPYDAADPPTDMAETTTDQGVTVPFIIRLERGTLNRGFYSFAVLFDPSNKALPWEPPAAWNGKVFSMFFGGGSMMRHQFPPVDVSWDTRLSDGFVLAATSLDTPNKVLSAEAFMMLKERITETFGPIRYTFGLGGSGGAIDQHFMANAYPGLLDGILVGGSFPDIMGLFRDANDCSLLLRYFKSTSPTMWEDVTQRNAVMDNANELPGTCEAIYPRFENDPAVGCLPPTLLTPEWVYNAETNPEGVRCTWQDYQVAIFGTRSDGFANQPYDNVGVQYGLVALEAGIISPEQFADVNEEVGGLDIDFNWLPVRSEADPMALDVAYRTGQVNLAHGMNTVPIIDTRECSNNEQHACYHTFVMRARIALKTHGSTENHVVLLSVPDFDTPIDLMDRWMAAIEADTTQDPLTVRVVRNKPAEAADACWIDGERVTDMERCLEAYPYFGNARTGAGQPLGGGVMKCQLKPHNRSSYSVSFTDGQWARMEAAFRGGVCDWTLPGVGYTPAVPWLSFADGPGGRPLGPAPVSLVVRNSAQGDESGA